MNQVERDEFEMDGFRTEAATQFGFEATNDDRTEYKCTEAALLAFAKACERKGMADALAIAKGAGAYVAIARLTKRIAELDTVLTPLREAEEARFMTAQGYVRARDDQPGARWIKPEPCGDFKCENCIGMPEAGCYCKAQGAIASGGPLCDDEGCPHHGTEHVCVTPFDFAASRVAAQNILDCMDQNYVMFDACSEGEGVTKARELYEAAKRLRDLLVQK